MPKFVSTPKISQVRDSQSLEIRLLQEVSKTINFDTEKYQQI